jgi:hypothetical protein
METVLRRRAEQALPVFIGAWGAAAAVVPGTTLRLAMVLPVAAAALIWWCLGGVNRWLMAFFLVLLLTPPLPFPLGDTGVHCAPLLATIGMLAGLVRLSEWNVKLPPVGVALLAFTGVLAGSAALGGIYSGPMIGLASMMRVGLFGIGVFVFFWVAAGPKDPERSPLSFFRFLFSVAMAVAAFGCVDYYYQLPAPAGFEPQFIWLTEGVFRRAQGLFYEASTLGNFCAFFLTMIAVALCRPREQRPCSTPVLLGGGALLGAAMLLSWSRASVVNVAVAGAVLLIRRRTQARRTLFTAAIALAGIATAVATLLPSVAASYWNRITQSALYLAESPDGVLSGRLTHWAAIANFLQNEPWHLFWGIGYKTLPYANVTGAPVIADNTWLSLLTETGLVGFAVFLILNWTILRASLQAARSLRPVASFAGEWMLCFWAGEMVQMFSGDLITYWRVLPVYWFVLGVAIRESEAA